MTEQDYKPSIFNARVPMCSIDWYIVRVQPSLESLAAAFLEAELDGETYYPMERGRKVLRHVLADYERAAFAGYLYARFPSPPDWRRVSEHCRAKPRLIMREGVGDDEELHPLWERDACVCRLRALEDRGQFSIGMANPFIAKFIGAKVAVPCGPFKGQIATVTDIVENSVILMFRALGRTVNMTVLFDQAFPGR